LKSQIISRKSESGKVGKEAIRSGCYRLHAKGTCKSIAGLCRFL